MSDEQEADRRDVIDPTTLKKVEDAYHDLRQHAHPNTLIMENLTPALFDQLKMKKSKLGSTLADVIDLNKRCAETHLAGLFPPCHGSYSTFGDLYSPVISGYYCPQFHPGSIHPADDFGENRMAEIGDVDTDHKYVQSTRIRLCRTVAGVRFAPFLSGEAMTDLENRLRKALDAFGSDPELKGSFTRLMDMSKEMQAELTAGHMLFRSDSQ